ncbi:hypothetical protein C9426_00965 [Serratia sp. S1B]|nr:hypothetical protein C9426_00965 [Serratia sp. S1B]
MTCTSCACNDLVLELLQILKAQIQSQAEQNNLLAQIIDQNNDLIASLCDDTDDKRERYLDDE